MKKQTKLILAAVAVLVLAILVVSLLLPKAGKDLTSGSFGKADKYHNTAMSANDVQLRSEFVKDTVVLKRMITGLATFQKFNIKTCRQIDSSLLSFQNHPILTDQAYNRPMFALKDFTAFLSNQNSNIASTQRLLESFYTNKDLADQSVDIEQNLRDFGMFVQQLVVRDSVLEIAALDIDNYIDKARKKKKTNEDTKPLQQFRDQLIVANMMTAAMLGQTSTLSRLSRYATTVNADDQIVSAVLQFNAMNSSLKSQTAGMQSMMQALNSSSLNLYKSVSDR
ncbi:MAG: hypothetical protein WCO02_09695 [Bacteroidota bacterium]